MKEDAVPVGKVDLHYYVSLRAFALLYPNISPVRSVTDRQISQGFVLKAGCLLAEILICIIVGFNQQSLVHKNV